MEVTAGLVGVAALTRGCRSAAVCLPHTPHYLCMCFPACQANLSPLIILTFRRFFKRQNEIIYEIPVELDCEAQLLGGGVVSMNWARQVASGMARWCPGGTPGGPGQWVDHPGAGDPARVLS